MSAEEGPVRRLAGPFAHHSPSTSTEAREMPSKSHVRLEAAAGACGTAGSGPAGAHCAVAATPTSWQGAAASKDRPNEKASLVPS